MTVPTPAQVEHAPWRELKGLAVRFGLNPRGKSTLVRQRILDYVRAHGGDVEWTPKPEDVAILLHRVGFPDAAARRWEDAIHLESPGPWIGLGSAYLRTGRLERAVNCFDRALQMGDPVAHLHKAEALSAAGADEPALEEAQSYLAEHPEDARGWAARGALLRRLGRMDEAVSAYRVIADLRPDVPDVWTSIGCLLLEAGRDEEAAHAFGAATELDPRDALAWNNRGVAQIRMGQRDEGLESIRRASAIDPRFAAAVSNKGVAYFTSDRKAAAFDALQAASRLADDAAILANLGLALERSRRNEKAREAFGRALELDPEEPRALAGRRRLGAGPRARPRKASSRKRRKPTAKRPRGKPGRKKATARKGAKASGRTGGRRAAGRTRRSRR